MERKFLLLIGAFAWMLPHGAAAAADAGPALEPVTEFQRAMFDDATFTVHLRNYLFDRYENSGDSDPAAWALGGWIGYESDWLADVLKVGVFGYTSQPLWGPENREGSLLLKQDQDGYSVLGQAYAALKFEDQVLTLYRQLVNQPEVNAQDNRMTPNTFEGGSLKGDIGPVSYYAGILTAMKERNADDFINIAEAASTSIDQDSRMYLGGFEVSPVEELKARTSLYVVPDLLASSYSDAVLNHPLTEDTSLRLTGQFMYQAGIGEELLTGPDYSGWIGGVKGDVIYNGLTLTAGYTFANDFSGTEDIWQAPFGSWPGFTSMIVKDFSRTEEQALLIGASYDFSTAGLQGLLFTALAAFDLAVGEDSTGGDLPMWNEYDFTADYKLSALDGDLKWLAPLWLRARYALVDIDNPDAPSSQIEDFRVILNYELQFNGKDL